MFGPYVYEITCEGHLKELSQPDSPQYVGEDTDSGFVLPFYSAKATQNCVKLEISNTKDYASSVAGLTFNANKSMVIPTNNQLVKGYKFYIRNKVLPGDSYVSFGPYELKVGKLCQIS